MCACACVCVCVRVCVIMCTCGQVVVNYKYSKENNLV